MNATAGVRFRVLGPITATRDGSRLDLGSPQQRLTLALLLADFGAPRSADRLIDSIWGESPPPTARKTLQVYVSHLRAALGEECIESVSGGYRVVRGWLDAAEFEARLASGRRLLGIAGREAADTLAAALAMWNGPPYSGFEDSEALGSEIARLEELRVSTIEDRITADLEAGGAAALVGELESLSREYPWRERFRAQLMVALYRAGRQADALLVFRRTRDQLVEELGVEPGPELAGLQLRILEQDPGLMPSRSGRAVVATRAVRGYELREEVRRGPHGRVYRAFDRGGGRIVAIKMIPPEIANRVGFLERFEPTAQLLARLDHPGVVPLSDSWRDPDGAYLVSAWLPGGSLRSALGGGRPWAPEAALALIGQVADGLVYAHRSGIVHGGLKPENILLDETGRALLADFPISPDVAGSYVAPELATGGRATAASDIYAFGLIVHELLTGSLPDDGRPSRLLAGELQRIVARAIAADPAARFAGVEELSRALRVATGSDVVQVAVADRSTAPRPRNPYKGLRAFQESDAADFFGRGAMVRQVIDRAARGGLVAVVGPSGCGKSSLVRAGVVPELRRLAQPGPLLVTEMFPGSHPFEELETALRRVAVAWPRRGVRSALTADARGLQRVAGRILPADDSRLVVVVDQFEELFSLVEDEGTRALFLESLGAAARDPRARVLTIVTLRADFFDRPLEHPTFGRLLEASVVPLTTPSRQQLAEAVSGPAGREGLELEDGLVSEIVADVDGQPGALPLMQFALADMVERGDGRRLTLDGYRATGGVAGAVGSRAEEAYLQQPGPGREALRQALFRLVHVDDGGAQTRRRVRRAELAALDVDQVALSAGLQAFAARRLLTFDRDPITRGGTVEVAHESLLRSWPRLRAWIDDRRQDLVLRGRLAQARSEWLANGADDAFLLAGVRLAQLEAWQATSDLQLTRDELEFIRRSRVAEDEHRRRTVRLRAGFSAVAATLVVIGALLGVLAIQQGAAAERAEIERLARTALALARVNPEQSLLVSLAAADQASARTGTVPDEVAEALHEALIRDRLQARIPQGGVMALSADGHTLAVDGGGSLSLLDTNDLGAGPRSLAAADGPLEALAFDPAGAMLYGLDDAGNLLRWDTQTGQPVTLLSEAVRSSRSPDSWSLDINPTGTLLVAGNGQADGVTVIDPAAPTNHHTVAILDPTVARFSPNGRRLAIATAAGKLFLVDMPSGSAGAAPSWSSPHGTSISGLDWSPDGKQIALATLGSGTQLLDVERGTVTWTVPDLFATVARFDPQGDRVAIGSRDGSARVVDAATGASIATLSGHTLGITGLAFNAQGTHVVTTSDDGTTRLWDVGPTAQHELRTIVADDSAAPELPAFSPDGSILVTGSQMGRARIWDAATLRLRATIGGAAKPAGQVAISPDGQRVAVAQGRPSSDMVQVFDPRLATIPTGTGIFDTSGRLLMPPLNGHRGTVVGRAWSPDGARLVTGGRGGILNLWNATTGELLDSYDAYSAHGGLTMLSFNADGTLVAGGSDDGTFTVWSVEGDHLQPVRTVKAHTSTTFAQFSRDGERIATVSADGFGAVWTVDGSLVARLIGHTSVVWFVAWVPDDDSVITESLDGTLRLWNAATGALRMTLTGVGPPVGVAVRRDGVMAVQSGDQGQVFLYTLDKDRLVQLARDRVTRSLTAAECRTFAIDPCLAP